MDDTLRSRGPASPNSIFGESKQQHKVPGENSPPKRKGSYSLRGKRKSVRGKLELDASLGALGLIFLAGIAVVVLSVSRLSGSKALRQYGIRHIPDPAWLGNSGYADLARRKSEELKLGQVPRIENSRKFSNQEWTNEFSCKGFVHTYNCDTHEPVSYLEPWCGQPIGSSAGFCLFEHSTLGRFRVMHKTCPSGVRSTGDFTCDLAKEFLEFKINARHFVMDTVDGQIQERGEIPNRGRRGIVIPARLSEYSSVLVIVKLLQGNGCVLPIEVWGTREERDQLQSSKESLQYAKKLEQHGVIFRYSMDDRFQSGFMIKPYSIYHSAFSEVLLLDADNFPITDPSELFNSAEFDQNGAIFFPDFWDSTTTRFGLDEDNLIWELLGIQYENRLEQESGQLVIDKDRSTGAMNVLMYFALHYRSMIGRLGLLYGDKDMYRLAWHMAQQPYHFVETPPGTMGIPMKNDYGYCGSAMIQYDTSGTPMFCHRNSFKPHESAILEFTLMQDSSRKRHKDGSYKVVHSWRKSASGMSTREGYCYTVEQEPAKALDPQLLQFEKRLQELLHKVRGLIE